MNDTEPQGPAGPNWVVRIVVGIAIVGGLAWGGVWFVESSRLSDQVNDLIARTHDEVYTPMLEGAPSVADWLEQAPELWQPIIDSSSDLLGTGAEDAHLLSIAMRDELVGYLTRLRAFELRAFQVLALLNSHPESTLGQMRFSTMPSLGVIADLNLNAGVDIQDEEALARLFSESSTFGGDYYTWDNDLALFQAIRQGHGPALLERIGELSEQTQSLAEDARAMSRSIRSQISQSSLPEGQRTRMLSDWNDFASTVGGMVVPYERNGRQFLVEYTRYVEYIMAEIEPEELQFERLYELDPIRTRNLSRLRSNIEMAAR